MERDGGRHGGETAGSVDAALFRHVLGHFASGLVVVTATHDGGPVGMTAQSFTSLSLDPPLVMFCPAKRSGTWQRIRPAGHFAVNILNDQQEDLGRTFARTGIDRFAGTPWHPGRTGAPLLDGVLAQIECSLEAVHDGGDHHIVVGHVRHLTADPTSRPLVVFRSDFGAFTSPVDSVG